MARPRIELDISKIEGLAGRGLTESEICLSLGISRNTLIRRKKDYDDLATAIKRGKANARAVVANALFENAKNGNVAAAIWFEKTRWGITEDGTLLERIKALEDALERLSNDRDTEGTRQHTEDID